MPTFTKKRLLIFCIILLLADIVFIKLYVDRIKPDPFMSVGLSSYRNRVIFINLIFAFIIFLLKRKYTLIFLTNAIVCGLLITFFWNYYIETHPFSSTEYRFDYRNKNYILGIDNNPDFYGISYARDSLCQVDIGSWDDVDIDIRNSIYLSMHEKKGDSILLHKDFNFETREYSYMYFYKDTLIGFPEEGTKIKVTEIIN